MGNQNDLPYAVKRTKVVWLIQNHPPPTPMCFDDRESWQTYLLYLHASGETITRRQDTGKWSKRRVVVTVFDRIDYCADCEIGSAYQKRMATESRCILKPVTDLTPEPATATEELE